MPKCIIKGCEKLTRHKTTSERYCPMHKERFKRHGYFELKKERGEHGLEKLPHKFVDDYILENLDKMIDKEISDRLVQLGYGGATTWNIRYRRRKLGNRKYSYGEIKKHKAWIRTQAINRYGNRCELCAYDRCVDAHHVIPKREGGPHEIDNLMVICPNCHALITRQKIILKSRADVVVARKSIVSHLKSLYSKS
ncbi:MAG: HNH endonuclease [Patescibacteria group bacterium]